MEALILVEKHLVQLSLITLENPEFVSSRVVVCLSSFIR